jgi:hypothetical protein
MIAYLIKPCAMHEAAYDASFDALNDTLFGAMCDVLCEVVMIGELSVVAIDYRLWQIYGPHPLSPG